MKILLPEFSLIFLLGVSGSGKSTFARQHFAPTEIISSDQLRAMICDDENNQRANKETFEVLHLLAAKRLANHKLTVIDATNVEAAARQPLLALAQEYQASAIAIVLNLKEVICLVRDAERTTRTVGKTIIHQQSYNLRMSLGGLRREGFSKVYNLFTPAEIATVEIEIEKA